MQIKELAEILRVQEDTIINWEYRRMQPIRSHLKRIVSFLKPKVNGVIPEKDFWQLCFRNNKLYPKKQTTFGEKLRAIRMQTFLSISQLANELNVDPSSINRWEMSKSDPLQKHKDLILAWIKQKEK